MRRTTDIAPSACDMVDLRTRSHFVFLLTFEYIWCKFHDSFQIPFDPHRPMIFWEVHHARKHLLCHNKRFDIFSAYLIPIYHVWAGWVGAMSCYGPPSPRISSDPFDMKRRLAGTWLLKRHAKTVGWPIPTIYNVHMRFPIPGIPRNRPSHHSPWLSIETHGDLRIPHDLRDPRIQQCIGTFAQ